MLWRYGTLARNYNELLEGYGLSLFGFTSTWYVAKKWGDTVDQFLDTINYFSSFRTNFFSLL